MAKGLLGGVCARQNRCRLRHREGADVAWDALRRWLRRRCSKPAGLLKMAAHFHGAERAVRHALEIVL